MVKQFILQIIRFYQSYVSNILGPRCRFFPSCSEYCKEAVQCYGAGKGLLLGLWRLLRCNPYSKGGYDPVINVRTYEEQTKENIIK